MIDLDRLLKLRLVVARHGEMDRAGWWNTNGMLGRYGAIALERGLPRTHRFAQARVVFAVARSRCEELFDPPGCVTLWKLPADVEDQFDEHWQALARAAATRGTHSSTSSRLVEDELDLADRAAQPRSASRRESRQSRRCGAQPKAAPSSFLESSRSTTIWSLSLRPASPKASRGARDSLREAGRLSMAASRSKVVSSFTIIKGSLIDETYAAFAALGLLPVEARESAAPASATTRSARKPELAPRRSQGPQPPLRPGGRDRPLVELAQGGCDRAVWRPLLLWHMTRDEFLVRDFLITWLYPQYVAGAYRLTTGRRRRLPRLARREERHRWSGDWTRATTDRVASGLLRIAADFGLLTGGAVKEFASYHLPDESFLYLLHAMAAGRAQRPSDHRLARLALYLMDSADVERELLRLHQFHRLRYEAAGSLARLDLPADSPAAYAGSLSHDATTGRRV